MTSARPGTVDGYLAALPDAHRRALLRLRSIIRKAYPRAEEALYYRLPAFRLDGKAFVAYRASRAHCSLHPLSATVLPPLKARLGGFSWSRGTLRFTPEHPVPAPLLKAILRARAAEISAAGRKGAARKRPARKPMKAYPSFDAYLADQERGNRAIIRALRAFVKRVAPGLRESVKWGNGCWLGAREPVVYVYAADDYVQFGFFRGSTLEDPRRLLEGEGQWVRHIKVRSPSGIDERAFGALLRQAARR